jgi:integrase
MARRAYGTGSLTTRRDASGAETWYGLWRAGNRRIKRALGPKRAAGSRDGLTRTQAEAELRRRMQEGAVAVGRAERKNLAEAGGRYMEHLATVKLRKRTTIQDYRGYLRRHLVPHFGERTLDRIEPDDVERYMHDKLATLAPKTVANHLTFLHGLFAFALRRRWAKTNPVALVDRPPAAPRHGRRISFLQPVEVEALLHAVPDDDLGATDAVLYLCAVTTGLRQGELLALKWLDVDWLACRIRVADNFPRGRGGVADTPKSHCLRSVPMADRLAGELERHFQHSRWCSDEDLVFGHPHTGLVYDASALRGRFYGCLERAGLRRITFHELRHTFGTQMAAAGAPLRAIQEWMGHSDAKTTEIYAHYAPDATNGAAFVERVFASAPIAQRSAN